MNKIIQKFTVASKVTNNPIKCFDNVKYDLLERVSKRALIRPF